MSQIDNSEAPVKRSVLVTLVLVLAIIIIFLGFFSVFSHLPSSGVQSESATPTAILTNPAGTLPINKAVDFSGLHITVIKAEEAASFSDDRKHGGQYTVRLHFLTRNDGKSAIGIDYPHQLHLLLPDGNAVAPKYVALSPVVLPQENLAGFVDFPIAAKTTLSELTLRLGNETLVPLGAA